MLLFAWAAGVAGSGALPAARGFGVSWCRSTSSCCTVRARRRAAVGLWGLFALANVHHSVETWLPNYHDIGRADARLGADPRVRTGPQ